MGNGTNEEEASSDDDGPRTPTEPTVGMLIDVGNNAISFLAEHMGPNEGEKDRGVSPNPSTTGSQSDGGASTSFASWGSQTNSSSPPAQLNVTMESSESNKTTPRGSMSSVDFDNNLIAKDDVSDATKREFNMSINTYTPELPFAAATPTTMEGMSTNPKLEGQSNRKPWQSWDDSDDSDDFWDIDDEDSATNVSQRSEASTHQKYHPRQKSPQAKPALFNPFPTKRRLKSEANRTRNMSKLGLYKVPQGRSQQTTELPTQRMGKLGW